MKTDLKRDKRTVTAPDSAIREAKGPGAALSAPNCGADSPHGSPQGAVHAVLTVPGGAAEHSAAQHGQEPADRRSGTELPPPTDPPNASPLSHWTTATRRAALSPLGLAVKERRGSQTAPAPRPVAGRWGRLCCVRGRTSARVPLGRRGGRTAAHARWAAAGFAMAAGGKSFLADAGYGEQELDANSALMELDKGEDRG